MHLVRLCTPCLIPFTLCDSAPLKLPTSHAYLVSFKLGHPPLSLQTEMFHPHPVWNVPCPPSLECSIPIQFGTFHPHPSSAHWLRSPRYCCKPKCPMRLCPTSESNALLRSLVEARVWLARQVQAMSPAKCGNNGNQDSSSNDAIQVPLLPQAIGHPGAAAATGHRPSR